MPPARPLIDGLWYCLCPSFHHSVLRNTSILLATGERAKAFRNVESVSRRSGSALARQSYSTAPEQNKVNAENDNRRSSKSVPTECMDSGQTDMKTKDNNQNEDPPKLKFKKVEARKPLRQGMGVPKDLERKSTANLESLLQDLMAKSPSIHSATQILRILIRDRHVRPEVRHYRALILANTDAQRGSPENVRNLLKEMENNGIPADSATLHAALQALAVHPDYVLRQHILHILRERWLSLSPAGWHHVVAGLIRENQFELALDHIAHMERKDIHVESWLHSLLVYNLCDAEEFDEVLNLMRARVNQGHEMTINLWLYVLDVGSEALHPKLTTYVWKHVVELGYLNPSYGVCSNVLTLASRTGDTELAASVFRFLAQSDAPFSLEDYEKLVEANIMAGDLYAAFDILCSMHKSGIELEESSTRSILTYMIQTNVKPQDAWAMLKRLKSLKKDIPVGCANVVIELCEHIPLADDSAIHQAIGFYKELYALCSSGANAATYNSLIHTCRRAKNTQACMFAVKEMAALEVPPDATTFERLILMSLDSGNFQSAYMYFRDMIERNWALSEGARTEIRKLCQGSNDDFGALLSSHEQIRGNPTIRKTRTEMITQPEGPPESGNIDNNNKGMEGRNQRRNQRRWRKVEIKPRKRVISRQQQLEHRAWGRVWRRELRQAGRKDRRKEKRRQIAIARGMEEEGWQDWDAGGLAAQEESETNKEQTPGKN